jgi:hypothetical protein
MQTPFRNDVDALKTRLASLDEELASLRQKAREYEQARERLAQIEAEHADVRREIDDRSSGREAPLLDGLRIASPCHERWENMIGDDRTRFCASCQKNVHNVSEMTRAEAETFLESVAGPVCVRMYKRADGTVITADCPVGVRKKRVKRLFLTTIGGGLAAAAGALALWRYEESTVMGQMVAMPMGTVAPIESAAPSPTFATPPDGPGPKDGPVKQDGPGYIPAFMDRNGTIHALPRPASSSTQKAKDPAPGNTAKPRLGF